MEEMKKLLERSLHHLQKLSQDAEVDELCDEIVRILEPSGLKLPPITLEFY